MLEFEERDEVTIARMAHGKVNALDAELLQAIAKALRLMSGGTRQLQGPARDRLASVSQAEDDASTQMWASPAVQDAINGLMSALKQR